MLIPKKNRREVYKHLFKEGVLQAERDYNLPKHPELPEVPNLQVLKLMQSFESHEYVTVRYSWRHYYWFLTDKGIEYLREYLNLPSEIVPATLKKSTRPLERVPQRPERGDRPPRREGDRPPRDGYRSGPPREGGFGRGGPRDGADKAGAPGSFAPQFGA